MSFLTCDSNKKLTLLESQVRNDIFQNLFYFALVKCAVFFLENDFS